MIVYEMEENGRAIHLRFEINTYSLRENEKTIPGDILPDPYVLYSDSYKVEFSKDSLRQKRNALLAATDWRDLPSYAGTKQAKWRTYRQALRDLPSGLDTEEKVKNVTWPTKP